MISPGTEASGASLPSTAHSISRASGTAASTTILRSKLPASAIASRSPARPSPSRCRRSIRGSPASRTSDSRAPSRVLGDQRRGGACHSWRRTTRYGQTGRPRAANSDLHHAPCPCRPPRRARRRRRRGRWRARAGPGSCRPRRTGRAASGKMTSSARPVTTACRYLGVAVRASGRSRGSFRRSAARRNAPRAPRATAGPPRAAPARSPRRPIIAAGGLSASAQRPSFSMRIGTGSYRVRSRLREHRRRRRQRHFVLAGSSAVQHADAKTFHRCQNTGDRRLGLGTQARVGSLELLSRNVMRQQAVLVPRHATAKARRAAACSRRRTASSRRRRSCRSARAARSRRSRIATSRMPARRSSSATPITCTCARATS